MAQVPTPEEIQRSAIDARSRAQSQADHPEPAAQFIIQPRLRFAETAFGFQWGNQAFTTSIRHGASPVDVANALSALSNEILRGGAVASDGLSNFDRLKLEHDELRGRLRKFDTYLAGPIPISESDLLNAQAHAMREYLAILAARIENIEHTTGQTSATRRPVHEGLEAEPDVREIGGHDDDRDGPVKFEG